MKCFTFMMIIDLASILQPLNRGIQYLVTAATPNSLQMPRQPIRSKVGSLSVEAIRFQLSYKKKTMVESVRIGYNYYVQLLLVTYHCFLPCLPTKVCTGDVQNGRSIGS